jgi:hypothetical protein
MNKSLKINRHPTLSDNIIYSTISAINKKHKTKIDPEQFFDKLTCRFCQSFIEDDNLILTFPVIATTEYAELSLQLIDNMPQTNTISYNNAFKKEIERITLESEETL